MRTERSHEIEVVVVPVSDFNAKTLTAALVAPEPTSWWATHFDFVQFTRLFRPSRITSTASQLLHRAVERVFTCCIDIERRVRNWRNAAPCHDGSTAGWRRTSIAPTSTRSYAAYAAFNDPDGTAISSGDHNAFADALCPRNDIASRTNSPSLRRTEEHTPTQKLTGGCDPIGQLELPSTCADGRAPRPREHDSYHNITRNQKEIL